MASQVQTVRTPSVHPAILLIDDQRFVGLALARLLDGEPFALHCCERGADAVAEADRLQPTLILQDLVMPDVDGLTLVRTFRERPATARIPVIVLSGNDDESTRARAHAAGAADYLVKLPAKDVLLASFRRALSAPGSEPAAVAAAADTDDDAVLDPGVIAVYRDDGAPDPDEALRALLDVFHQDAARLMTDLRAAVTEQHPSAARAAHALKGCALAIGARRLAALCAELETHAAAGRPALDAIECELVRVHAACAQLRGTQRCGI